MTQLSKGPNGIFEYTLYIKVIFFIYMYILAVSPSKNVGGKKSPVISNCSKGIFDLKLPGIWVQTSLSNRVFS